MHKCEHCGTEFDENFCPHCGTPVPAPVHEKRERKPVPFLVKVCARQPYFISVLFAIFSVLLFLLCLGEAASSPFAPTESVYDYLAVNGRLAREAGMGTVWGCCVALVVFASFGAAWAGCALLFRSYIPLRVMKLGKRRVCFYLECGIFAFLFIDFLISCVLCGTPGSELTKPGAGSICALVFSLLFGALITVSAFLPSILNKVSPASVAAYREERSRARAALHAPEAPEGDVPQKPRRPQYRVVAGPQEELLAQTVKYGKGVNLFAILASIGVIACVLLFLVLFVGIVSQIGGMLGQSFADLFDCQLGEAYLPFTLAVSACCFLAFLLIMILGIVLNKKYYKKQEPNAVWRPERVLKKRRMNVVLAVVLPLLLLFLNFMAALILISLESQKGGPSHAYYGLENYWIVAPILNCIVAAIYSIAIAIAAPLINRRGKRLCKSLYGAEHPRLVPELQAEYLESKKNYPAEAKAYRAQRRVWRAYRRKLAYFEEGVAPPIGI